MPTAVQKGRAAENLTAEYLEGQGWQVHKAVRIRYQGCDIFKCDVIGKKPGQYTWWVQVTAAKRFTRKYQDLVPGPWGPGDRVSIFHWVRGTAGIWEVNIHEVHPQPA